MKTINWIFISIAVIVMFAVVAAIGSGGGGNTSSGGAARDKNPTETCKIYAAQGVTTAMLQFINVTNKNTGAHFCFFYNDLPVTFSFAPSDILAFQVQTKLGYTLNGWRFGDGTFDHHNPLEDQFKKDFTITIHIMRVQP